MNVTELTALIISITGLLSGVGLPLYDQKRRKARQKEDDAKAENEQKSLTTSGVLQVIERRNDRLQEQLDKQAAEHTREIEDLRRTHAKELAAAEAKWQAQHEKDQTQILGLREEIDALYRRLYQPPPVRQ